MASTAKTRVAEVQRRHLLNELENDGPRAAAIRQRLGKVGAKLKDIGSEELKFTLDQRLTSNLGRLAVAWDKGEEVFSIQPGHWHTAVDVQSIHIKMRRALGLEHGGGGLTGCGWEDEEERAEWERKAKDRWSAFERHMKDCSDGRTFWMVLDHYVLQDRSIRGSKAAREVTIGMIRETLNRAARYFE